MGLSGKVYSLPLVVVNTSRKFTPLLGRNWLNVLYDGWKSIFVSGSEQNLINDVKSYNKERILKKFPRVFNNDSSKPIKFHKAEIILSKNATPIFSGPYTIAYGR